MKWIIKNPAPLDERLEKWGDYHFGRCVAKWLIRMGQEVESHYFGQWENDQQSDVVLVLRGKFPYHPRSRAIHVLWLISHPDTVDLKELSRYQIVFVASKRHAAWIESRLHKQVHVLLQCADTEQFRPVGNPENNPRTDFVFVGNSRGVRRRSVLWAIDANLPLKCWGRDWEGWIPSHCWMGEYFDNQKLPELYSNAKVTLNDHWRDMKRWGYINNRIFEALACGLPVISDYQEEIEQLFPHAVLMFRNRDQFYDCIGQVLLDYPRVTRLVQKTIPEIRAHHSFEGRVSLILKEVQQFKDDL